MVIDYIKQDNGDYKTAEAADGHYHIITAAQVQSILDAAINKSINEDTKETNMSKETENKELDSVREELEAEKAKNARFEAIAKLAPEVTEYFKSLETEAQDKFLEKSANDQAIEAKKAVEVVLTDIDGTEYKATDFKSDTELEMKKELIELKKANAKKEKAEIVESFKAFDLTDATKDALAGLSEEARKELTEKMSEKTDSAKRLSVSLGDEATGEKI